MSNEINNKVIAIESAIKNNNRDNPWQEFLLSPLYSEKNMEDSIISGYFYKLLGTEELNKKIENLHLNTS